MSKVFDGRVVKRAIGSANNTRLTLNYQFADPQWERRGEGDVLLPAPGYLKLLDRAGRQASK